MFSRSSEVESINMATKREIVEHLATIRMRRVEEAGEDESDQNR